MASNARQEGWQGANWIRPEKRLALYLRDDLSCAYCGEGLVDGAPLTLDHVKSVDRGGSNDEGNLVTACRSCNSAKNGKTYAQWLHFLAEKGFDADAVRRRVRNLRRRKLHAYKARALRMIEHRPEEVRKIKALNDTRDRE